MAVSRSVGQFLEVFGRQVHLERVSESVEVVLGLSDAVSQLVVRGHIEVMFAGIAVKRHEELAVMYVRHYVLLTQHVHTTDTLTVNILFTRRALR